MNRITVLVKYYFSRDNYQVKQIDIDSLDISLLDLCLLAEKRYKTPLFTFEHYYGKSWLMCEGEMLPYLLVNDTYVWNVPYKDVKLRDFLRTHEIDSSNPLVIEVNNCGGAGLTDFLYQGWLYLNTIMDYVGRGLTAREIVLFVINSFGNKRGQKPSFADFHAFILKREQWDIDDLAKRLNADKNVLGSILEVLGYENHEGIYWKNCWKVQQFEEATEQIIDKLYNDHGHPELNSYSLNDTIFEINNNVHYLYILDSMRKCDNEISKVTSLIGRFVEESLGICTFSSETQDICIIDSKIGCVTEELVAEIVHKAYLLRDSINEIVRNVENALSI